MRVNRWSFVFICLNQALWPDAQAQHRFGKGSPKRKKGSDHNFVHFDARGNEPSYGRTPFLSALARMKLTSFRDKDRTHLRDLIEVGLLDASWVARLPSELGVRLQHLLDNPEG
jgi:hypothetical protein